MFDLQASPFIDTTACIMIDRESQFSNHVNNGDQ